METQSPKTKSLISGPITPDRLAELMAKHQSETGTGAHCVFLGQIRADRAGEHAVVSITYSAYEAMAEQVIRDIRAAALAKFPDLHAVHIYHSLGNVKVGEASILVTVSSAHRKPVFSSLEWIVDECKHRLPIWKQEHLNDGSHRWVGEKPG
ncbi:MAG: molybdenum cofactor biosynthesis protein MoaE [Bacteroidota bacterium]